MAKHVKIKLNRAGVGALLRSREIEDACAAQAKAVAARCGDGYATDSYVGKTRANAMVWAKSAKARQDNYRNNTILKALK